MPLPDGRTVITTAVPARHGPVTIEALTGHVTGFVLSIEGSKDITAVLLNYLPGE
jgi:hypothetical protein